MSDSCVKHWDRLYAKIVIVGVMILGRERTHEGTCWHAKDFTNDIMEPNPRHRRYWGMRRTKFTI